MTNRAKIQLPEGKNKLLLHSCCAPCAGEIMLTLLESKIEYAIYFYNPNIHPKKEYELRKQENIRFAQKYGIKFFDDDYNVKNWFDRAESLKDEPEKGVRCTMCFDMRFEYAARFAYENGYDIFSSTLGISRWKNMLQINASGIRAAMHYPELSYLTYNWRKQGGGSRMLEVSKQENFYQQEYCGCAYSLRDTNKSRLERNKQRITLGKNYYSEN